VLAQSNSHWSPTVKRNEENLEENSTYKEASTSFKIQRAGQYYIAPLMFPTLACLAISGFFLSPQFLPLKRLTLNALSALQRRQPTKD